MYYLKVCSIKAVQSHIISLPAESLLNIILRGVYELYIIQGLNQMMQKIWTSWKA